MLNQFESHWPRNTFIMLWSKKGFKLLYLPDWSRGFPIYFFWCHQWCKTCSSLFRSYMSKQMCNFWCFYSKLTTVCLIWAIPAVPHTVTDEHLWDTAAVPIAADAAALGGFPAACFIRAIRTLRSPITHQPEVNTLLPLNTLKHPCKESAYKEQISMSQVSLGNIYLISYLHYI